ncbi:MAG TPA: AI-2E family transporter [Deltaproteobacteria bacterium]|nr:AI-2E family transporter [Deltaproteobacteria bacterium]HPR55004.1 AI-2E family transporter [Deltaproteobacteria bacterium]HXK46341.1 AI-2E family transporter [Deltaproteobacteria bacterium]
MKQILRRWAKYYFSDPQVMILIILLLAGFILIIAFGRMLIPVFVSIIVALLLDSVITWLARFNVRRNVAVYLVFILFMILSLDLLIILLPLTSHQVGQLVEDLPGMIAMVKAELLLLPQKYPGIISEQRVTQFLSVLSSEFNSFGKDIIKISVSSVRGLVEILVYMILVPFLVFFLLKDKETILSWLRKFMPEERGLAVLVWNEVYDQFFNYLRGKVLEILLVWAINYAAFAFLGLKYSVILSMFVGIAVLVPYIGSTVMFVPVVLIAFFQWGFGAKTITVMFAYAFMHALDGNIIAPLLLSKVVKIHPIAIIIAILIFGGIWGFWGLVFAIPLATLLHAVLKAWVSTAASLEQSS